jgi:signal transduction histidine kinase
VVTLSANQQLKKIKSRIGRLKLTTRITISNVVLFSIIIAILMYLITVLTTQFLYFKNKEDLLTKQRQIEELLSSESDAINALEPQDRIAWIYRKFEHYYIFDNYKTLIMLFDSRSQTSYSLNKEVYDMILLDQLKVNPANMDLNVSFISGDSVTYDQLNFEMYKRLDTNEKLKYMDISLRVPSKGSLPFVTESTILGYDVMYTTLRYDGELGYSAFVSIFLYPDLDKDFLLSLNSALLVSAFIGIVFLSAFSRLFTRKALKPLVELSYIAQNMNNETLNYRIPSTESNDEIDTLIKSLNLMLQNLELSFDYQKRFVSDASHELRIPLTIVLGYIDLLKTMGTSDEDLLRESLESIEDEATHMKNLVEKLLILARLENKRIKVNSEWLEIPEYFNKTHQECLKLYPKHDFHINMHYVEDVFMDFELMTQIFRALVENAVKYSPEGSCITFGSAKRNQFIELSVSDKGRGIAKESIAHLTNRFYRLNEDRNRKTGGTGLGLSIVDALIKAHGGHMRIESEPGHGTTILLFLPHLSE